MKRSTVLFAFAWLTSSIVPADVCADISEIIATSMSSVYSAPANGMGDCVIANVNGDAAIYNPGALGVFHFGHQFLITVPLRSNLFPSHSSGHWESTSSISMTLPIMRSQRGGEMRTQWKFALAYSRVHIRWNDIYHFWYPPQESHDISSNVTLAAAYRHGVTLGIGATYKYLQARLPVFGAGTMYDKEENTGSAFDLGFYASLDLPYSKPGKTQRWAVTPVIAFVYANAGGDRYAYFDESYAAPLPELTRYSTSIEISHVRGQLALKSLRIVYESEDWNGPRHADKYGFELGLVEMLFFRLGYYKDNRYRELATIGAGFSFAGAYDLFKRRGGGDANRFWDRLDLRFDYAHYPEDQDNDQIEELTNLFRLSIAIQN